MNITKEVALEIDVDIENVCCKRTIENKEYPMFHCCKTAVITHCFLVSGSLFVPDKGGYSLEFYTEEFKTQIKKVLEEFVIKVGEGKGGLYIRDRESICDVLVMMGANKAVLRLNDLIVERDFRRGVARVANCDEANMGRVVAASVVQCEVIEGLMKRGVISDERLLEVAIVRLQFRQDSYEELADRLGISKSTVRYRLGKLMGMAKKSNEEKI